MNFEQERSLMVARQLQARGIRDKRVLAAMGRVPRHLFVATEGASAYADCPLSIGAGQTISQPYMVAAMTEALELVGTERVLEIGTGSGYQTAVLAELAREVVSLERIDSLAAEARKLLAEQGYTNVEVIVGDGTLGRPEKAPYQGVLVTAGAPAVPRPLLDQLALGGRLVIPVGDRYSQVLEIHIRGPLDRFSVRRGTACRFVDLIGEHGWQTDRT